MMVRRLMMMMMMMTQPVLHSVHQWRTSWNIPTFLFRFFVKRASSVKCYWIQQFSCFLYPTIIGKNANVYPWHTNKDSRTIILKSVGFIDGIYGFHRHNSRIVGLNVPYRDEQKAISSFCCILRGPGGESIVDVVPWGTEFELRVKTGSWAGRTRNNPHVKCTGVYCEQTVNNADANELYWVQLSGSWIPSLTLIVQLHSKLQVTVRDTSADCSWITRQLRLLTSTHTLLAR